MSCFFAPIPPPSLGTCQKTKSQPGKRGCDFERRGKEVGAVFAAQAETELSGLCDDDEGAYRFRRGHGSGNSGRWRLATLKRALLYKLKNNENYAYAA